MEFQFSSKIDFLSQPEEYRESTGPQYIQMHSKFDH